MPPPPGGGGGGRAWGCVECAPRAWLVDCKDCLGPDSHSPLHPCSCCLRRPPLPPPQTSGDEWSECARGKLAVKAVKGSALLFYGLKPNGEEDNASTHGSCPTLAGEKWSATR